MSSLLAPFASSTLLLRLARVYRVSHASIEILHMEVRLLHWLGQRNGVFQLWSLLAMSISTTAGVVGKLDYAVISCPLAPGRRAMLSPGRRALLSLDWLLPLRALAASF